MTPAGAVAVAAVAAVALGAVSLPPLLLALRRF